jgi:hypothetical protein
VTTARRCSRTACRRPAVATLTYVYGDQTAVLGPLATYAEPHAYDLCDEHSDRLSAPRGWEVVRLALDPDALGPSSDDLLALADAVREAGEPRPAPPQSGGATATRVRAVPAQAPAGRPAERVEATQQARPGERRSHLRVLRPSEE